jgi:hypothetical protein
MSRSASARSRAFRPTGSAITFASGAQFVNITTQTLLAAGIRHWKERLDGARTGT